MSLIDVCAKNAKSAKDRRILSQMSENIREYQRMLDEMPEWAKECALSRTELRVPLMKKVEAENLEHREWTSKKGTPMMTVTFLDGTVREFARPASKWITWNEFSN